MLSSNSKIAKIQEQYLALAKLAPSLNSASDELAKAVAPFEETFKRLNLGLTQWVGYAFADVEAPRYDVYQIGYAKVQGKWGIALRRIWGNEQLDHHEEEGPWLFNDAPREMRLQSVDQIPELFEALVKAASDTTKKIREKTESIREMAAAIGKLTSPSKEGR